MNSPHYIGFDVHKKTISFCVKTAAGEILEEGVMAAQRPALQKWAMAGSQPLRGALEATLFSGWIYDTLKPYGEQLEAGRKTLTHTSWTGPSSVPVNDRWSLVNLNTVSTLRGTSLPSKGRPPSPLDFYLSWMSPNFASKIP